MSTRTLKAITVICFALAPVFALVALTSGSPDQTDPTPFRDHHSAVLTGPTHNYAGTAFTVASPTRINGL